ncbi:hypothetical protein [Acidipila rosea]|uniref:Uncharacterized protein n=1 Tax=Acidipila rosea TaxID=768535 RepID=A0A4R1L1N8_9BACT|nr:hypothetical protein [Acidipila rosea]TCK71784.1 hypothetical protein C7378_3074 [Acidipila rosea]
MDNYFNYFTEIEEHFQRRRGSLLLLSTLDWALIETWREAGIPLEAVLRGIDAAFDKHDARKAGTRTRRVNGLAWCAQAVMQAVEELQEAAVGIATERAAGDAPPGFEAERIAAHLEICAREISIAALPGIAGETAATVAQRLTELAASARAASPNLEELDRTLTVLEEKLLTTLLATAAEAEMVELKEIAARELAPYRSRMQAAQIRQVEQQFLHKRMMEKRGLPRLSLFYMSQS